MYKLIACVFALAIISAQALPQSESNTSHGTVNIILANHNGLIAITDSRLSNNKGPQGSGQKLFKVDDHTICTIAGFYMDSGAPIGKIVGLSLYPAYTTISSVLNDHFELERLSGTLSKLSAEQRLNDIARVLIPSLEMVTNTDKIIGSSQPPPESQITLAGYKDGKIVIAQMFLIPSIDRGVIQYTPYIQPEIEVKDKFVYKTAGLDLVARLILKNPEESAIKDPIDDSQLQSVDAVVKSFGEEMTNNSGTKLTTEDMIQLARDLEKRTAARYSVEVGGKIQTAVLAGGKIESFNAPLYGGAKGLSFSRIKDSYYSGSRAFPSNNVTYLFVSGTTFEDATQWLDKGLFTQNIFHHCHLTYSGSGDVLFDQSNIITDSVLELGPSVTADDPIVEMLREHYPALKIIQMGVRNPSTLN